MSDLTFLNIGKFTFAPAVELTGIKASPTAVIPGIYAIPGGGFKTRKDIEIWAKSEGKLVREELA